MASSGGPSERSLRVALAPDAPLVEDARLDRRTGTESTEAVGDAACGRGSPDRPPNCQSDAGEQTPQDQWHPVAITARALMLAALIAMALVTWAQFSWGSGWVTKFLLENTLELSQRMRLIYCMLGSAVAGACLTAGWLAVTRKQGRPLETVERHLWFLSPLILLPAVPMLFRWKAWDPRVPALIYATVVVLLATELLVFKSLNSVPRFISRVTMLASQRAPLLLRRHGPLIAVAVAALAYVLFMSFYTIQWHYKLRTALFDLGINNNLMYTGLHGAFLESRIVFPNEPTKYLANHAKFGGYAFLPIYALYPRPETLLALQSACLGLGALPLFGFARRWVSEWTAALISIAYLCYFPMHAANFYEMKWVPVASVFVLMTELRAGATDARGHAHRSVRHRCLLLGDGTPAHRRLRDGCCFRRVVRRPALLHHGQGRRLVVSGDVQGPVGTWRTKNVRQYLEDVDHESILRLGEDG
jgi:hypothetical protein